MSEFGQAPITASISSAQNATPDQLVELGKKIWAKVQASGVHPDDNPGNDKLLEQLQGEYKDFATSFPLILRWMVQLRDFSAKAFAKYLKKHAATKMNSRKEFLELQAEYPVYLYREKNTHADERKIRSYREKLVKQLLEEDESFKKIQKEVEEEVARRDAQVDRDRRQRLYEVLLARKVAQEKSATVPSEKSVTVPSEKSVTVPSEKSATVPSEKSATVPSEP